MPEQNLQILNGWRIPGSGGALESCSALIPTFNRYPQVIRLLEAIAALPDQPGEVVVVDGHASGDLSQRLKQWAATKTLAFDLVYAQSPPGLTVQRNAGIDVSTREYLYYFDDDTVPQPGYFARILEVFERDRRREIGVVGACITNEMDKPVSLRWRLRLKLGLVPKNLGPMRYFHACTSLPRGFMKLFKGTIPVDIVAGGASAWRREVFDKMRFSEYFQGYSQGEDVESSLRAGRHWKLVCCGDAHILHLHAPGGRPLKVDRGRMDVVNRYFIMKRYQPPRPLRYTSLFFLDVLFQVAMDLGYFVVRPWQTTPLLRATGLALGTLECFLSPPKYEEPPPRRRYALGQAMPEEAILRVQP
jgi:GT2 family glycosyltransferase